ncbi:MAG: hypothetical protein JO015_18995 [Verrucomicrobia bacterium]|nr:hypothetical protein [Verrucomicrobiota bacterium]
MKSGDSGANVRPARRRRPANRDRGTGFGAAPCHHGEWLQGEFQDGPLLIPGLVTVPCPLFRSRAIFTLTPLSATITVRPGTHVKALRAARLTLQWLQRPHLGGELAIRNRAPAGFGFGSSTADCLSAIRAVASAFGRILPAETEARLAIAAEGASDSTMFDASRPVLFSQCHGRILESFRRGWPEMFLLGFCTSTDGKGVDTAAVRRPAYAPAERREFARLRGDLRRGLEGQSVELLGRVAERSAELNHSYFPVPQLSELQALARSVGAAGIQVAHTGCLAGLIFRNDATSERSITTAQGGLAALGIARTWPFRIGENGACRNPR